MRKFILITTLLIVLLALFFFQDASPIKAVYLTLPDHPENQMTVHWVSDKEEQLSLLYRNESSDQNVWHEVRSTVSPVPDNTKFYVNKVQLLNLQASTVYQFRIAGSSELYRFQTLPDQLNKPLRFIDGGDVYHDDLFHVKNMCCRAASFNPAFAIVGGDFFYYVPHKRTLGASPKWLNFLRVWQEAMKTSDGLMIPIAAAIGNHDVIAMTEGTKPTPSLFQALFPAKTKRSYQVIDFGGYLSLFLLDTGHVSSFSGKQAEWLKRKLQERKERPYLIASYHIPAYPSVRSFDTVSSSLIRKHWIPLFEKYGLIAAFEHHDHAYSRTFPLRNNQIDENGIVFLGNGSWGVGKSRNPTPKEGRWYTAHTEPKQHVHCVEITGEKIFFQAIDSRGVIFDSYSKKLSD